MTLDELRAWYHEAQGTEPGEVLDEQERGEHHAYRSAEQGVLVNLDSPPQTEAGKRARDSRHHRGVIAVATRTLHSLSPAELDAAKAKFDCETVEEFTLRYLHAAVTHCHTLSGELPWRASPAKLLKQVHAAITK